jgi:hypothetical protein
MKGRAKVQMNGPRLFIYLPTKQSAQDKIVKGSFVDFDISNTGLDPEPPTKRALAMGNNRVVD